MAEDPALQRSGKGGGAEAPPLLRRGKKRGRGCRAEAAALHGPRKGIDGKGTMSGAVIQAEGLGKRYRRGLAADPGLRHALERFVKSPFLAVRS
jgi:hypothetical protein